MTTQEAMEKARDLAIWMTGGVLEFSAGTSQDVIEIWSKQITTALLQADLEAYNRGVEDSGKVADKHHGEFMVGSQHGKIISQAILKLKRTV